VGPDLRGSCYLVPRREQEPRNVYHSSVKRFQPQLWGRQLREQPKQMSKSCSNLAARPLPIHFLCPQGLAPS
jgi:hypothetical protein